MAEQLDDSRPKRERSGPTNIIGLGRWFGIEVGLHWSEAVIAAPVTVSLTLSYFMATGR